MLALYFFQNQLYIDLMLVFCFLLDHINMSTICFISCLQYMCRMYQEVEGFWQHVKGKNKPGQVLHQWDIFLSLLNQKPTFWNTHQEIPCLGFRQLKVKEWWGMFPASFVEKHFEAKCEYVGKSEGIWSHICFNFPFCNKLRLYSAEPSWQICLVCEYLHLQRVGMKTEFQV